MSTTTATKAIELQDRLDQRRQEITATKAEQRAEYVHRYRALVSASVDGDEIDPSEAVELLDSLDLPADQLDDDIDTVRQRRILRQHLDNRDAATERLQVVHADLSDKQAELQRIVREHRQAMQPLQAEEAQLQSQLSIAQNSECRLRNERPWWFADADKHLSDWRQSIGEHRRRLNGRIADEQRNLAKHEQLIANENGPQNPFYVSDENRSHYKKVAKSLTKKISELKQKLADLDAETADVEREAAKLDAEKLTP